MGQGSSCSKVSLSVTTRSLAIVALTELCMGSFKPYATNVSSTALPRDTSRLVHRARTHGFTLAKSNQRQFVFPKNTTRECTLLKVAIGSLSAADLVLSSNLNASAIEPSILIPTQLNELNINLCRYGLILL